MRFLVFIHECANNGKRLRFESLYDLLLFIFVLPAGDLISGKSDNIYG